MWFTHDYLKVELYPFVAFTIWHSRVTLGHWNKGTHIAYLFVANTWTWFYKRETVTEPDWRGMPKLAFIFCCCCCFFIIILIHVDLLFIYMIHTFFLTFSFHCFSYVYFSFNINNYVALKARYCPGRVNEGIQFVAIWWLKHFCWRWSFKHRSHHL